ncbi:MAG: hypothetical protein JW850_18005 [Thermoflexales bacterium]|nr:hypothetical protein [Thermoflexales bacterium]
MPTKWLNALNGDPRPWLLEDDTPAVKHAALRCLLDRPPNDPQVKRARAAAMQADPIAAILDAQHPAGYWVKPGAGYGPKYRGTVWQVIFLDQLGADGQDKRVRAACAYVLEHTQTETGGLGCSGSSRLAPPAPSSVLHCLNGNLLRALIGLGWLEDERVQRVIDWQARAITGEGDVRYYRSGTSGAGFCCAANDRLPCAWGAVKAMLALARVPVEKRAPHVEHAVQQGVEFLLSRDLTVADYPMPGRAAKPSGSWFRLGFPLGYITDVLQNLEALCELGQARHPRLQAAGEWLLGKQDQQGRWKNQAAYSGKTWTDMEAQGQPSKWVTLRACRVLKLLT